MNEVRLYFDGGCQPNPGNMEICIVFVTPDNKIRVDIEKNLGHGTSNEAEWLAMNYGLAQLISSNYTSAKVFGDSQLVINQISGIYRVHAKNLKPYFNSAQKLKSKLNDIDFIHLRREYNPAGHILESKNQAHEQMASLAAAVIGLKQS